MDTPKEKNVGSIDIDSFFVYEAAEIEMACKVADLLHNSKDIRASGNEVEISVRNFFKRKLESKFYVSNGHIVDSNLLFSSQFDIIIADNFKTPILYKTQDGTEFLTYESIYAIGEIKKRWGSDLLGEFIETITKNKSKLKREEVSSNFIDTGGKGLYLDIPVTEYPFQNPFFYFAFIASSDDFDFEDIRDTYSKCNDWGMLPNIICIMNEGIIVNIRKMKSQNNKFKINLYPEFVKVDEKDQYEWIFLQLEKDSSSLGSMYYLIHEHLNNCVLKQADLMIYMQRMFNFSSDDIIKI